MSNTDNAQATQATKEAAAAVAADAAKQPERTRYSPTSAPDGQPTPGKVVKDGFFVKSNTGGDMVDNLTLVPYGTDSWTEAKASAWLDGQWKAKKILVKELMPKE